MRLMVNLVVLMLLCAAGHATPLADNTTATSPSLPSMILPLAPEFPAGLQWLNTDRPLSLQALRGKVVLLDFWTYGCLNCLHILPDLQHLETTYANDLVVIGVHSAKYTNEAVLDNVRQAVQRYGITHAVVNDRDYALWKAYRIPGWPTQILIDPEGRLLQGFVGEHHRERLAQLIEATIAWHRQKGTLRQGPLPVFTIPLDSGATPLRYPGKVLVDTASARLFIADTAHHRLVVTDLHGNLLRIIGSGMAGTRDGPFVSAAFRQPQGMALLGSLLYVADTGNHLVRRVDLHRHIVETVAGNGEQAREFNVPGTGRGVPLNSPWDLYGNGAYLYIAMAGMHQVWRMTLDTFSLAPFAGSGQEALIDALRSEAALGQPSGLSGDAHHLYIADSEVNALRVASLEARGTLTTLAGGGLFTFGDHDGPGREARLQHPLGVAYAAGTLYVADTYNHKIKRFDLHSGQLHTLAGTGVPGQRDGAAGHAQFYEPGGVSIGAGRLYVADTNNHQIRVIDLHTQTVSTLAITGLTPPAVQAATDNDPGEVVRYAEQPLPASAQATVRIALDLPPGWKVNPVAPAALTVIASGDGARVPAESTRQTLHLLTPEVAIPLEVTQEGQRAQLRIDLTYVLCQTDDQGICALRQVTWEVPVRSQARTTGAEVALRYAVSPP
jgi:thiol-disulfide isomerase/thioredoxin/sugar lactone lactonase YvrE